MKKTKHGLARATGTYRLARAISALVVAAAIFVVAAPAAEARWLDLHAAAQVGAIDGWGSSSKPDFFDHTHGGAVGAEIGLKLLVVDLWTSFTQILDSSGASGTLSQLGLSIDVDIPVGRRKLSTGQRVQIIHPSVGFAFGFGTPGPVNPPLTSAQISDKGVLFPARVGYEYFLNPFVAVGAEAMFGYHYFFIDGSIQNHSAGYQFAGFGTVKFHLGI